METNTVIICFVAILIFNILLTYFSYRAFEKTLTIEYEKRWRKVGELLSTILEIQGMKLELSKEGRFKVVPIGKQRKKQI